MAITREAMAGMKTRVAEGGQSLLYLTVNPGLLKIMANPKDDGIWRTHTR